MKAGWWLQGARGPAGGENKGQVPVRRVPAWGRGLGACLGRGLKCLDRVAPPPAASGGTMAGPRVRLVVTADDFGYCPRRDEGIVEAFLAGAVTSVSLLVNGAAAESAAELARR